MGICVFKSKRLELFRKASVSICHGSCTIDLMYDTKITISFSYWMYMELMMLGWLKSDHYLVAAKVREVNKQHRSLMGKDLISGS